MPHHPLTIFSLVPVGTRAENVVNHSENEHLVSTSSDFGKVLDIGHHLQGPVRVRRRPENQRRHVPRPVQRPDEPSPRRKRHALRAGPRAQGGRAAQYEHGHQDGGGAGLDLTMFRLLWAEQRAEKRKELGRGNFGVVQKAMDLDPGRLMAVRIIRPGQKFSNPDQQTRFHVALKREVEAMSRIDHPCFVNYTTMENCDDSTLKIFMGLKEGTLTSLISGNPAPDVQNSIASTVLHDMLQALDYLTKEWSIIHRDVKPDNVLYVSGVQAGQYRFQLGDLGLCNSVKMAQTRAGTPIFMTPELWQEGKNQTDKVDIWSLFVTILWTLNVDEFRSTALNFNHERDALTEVVRLSRMPDVALISKMGIVDPERRASAEQMLVKCFNGDGLVVPSWACVGAPTTPPAEAVAAATTTATAQPPAPETTTTTTPVSSPPRRQRATTPRATGGADAAPIDAPELQQKYPCRPQPRGQGQSSQSLTDNGREGSRRIQRSRHSGELRRQPPVKLRPQLSSKPRSESFPESVWAQFPSRQCGFNRNPQYSVGISHRSR
ncbi:uncharacterized protein PG986_003666 [Apiospora aurea]|uniref:non-specific serine/threonine protein kinase n=1 Tax=Apiospora aurea TaxID=335848 RepID=A0ABR1QSD1_9PEZI